MERSLAVLDVEVDGCDVEVYVNDIPLFRVPVAAGGGLFQTDHVLVRGDNTFEVLIHPGSTPSVARTEKRTLPGDGVAVRMHLARCPPGTEPGESGTVSLFRHAETMPDGPLEFPRVVRFVQRIDPDVGPWAWERADVLSMDGALLQEATRYVQSMHAALARKSFAGFWAHNEIAHREACIAFDVALSERQSAAEAAITGEFAKPTFAMAPLVAEQFDYRLVAGGRLLECIAKDWRAVVRTEPDEEGKAVRFPILLGRMEGSLRGLR